MSFFSSCSKLKQVYNKLYEIVKIFLKNYLNSKKIFKNIFCRLKFQNVSKCCNECQDVIEFKNIFYEMKSVAKNNQRCEMSDKNKLPSNVNAELSLLGAMLFKNGEAISKVQSMLTAEDFFLEEHKIIYQAMTDLYAKENTVDVVTLNEYLQKKDLLDKIGGPVLIMTIGDSVATSANIVNYANIVKEKSTLRKLISAAEFITKKCYDDNEDLKNIMEDVEKKIFSITSLQSKGEFEHISSIATRVFGKINYLYENNGGYTGVPVGFRDLDDVTAGFQHSDFVLLAARPSMGKTALALNMAMNVAMGHGSSSSKGVAFFSLEMSKEQLVQRILSTDSGVDSQFLKTGQIKRDEWLIVNHSAGDISKAKLYIDDTPGLTVMDLRSRAKRLKSMHEISLIIIDYLQLMQGRKNKSGEINRQQEISEISRSLKAMARELNVPVVALSQLSRAVEMRSEKRPQLSDLRESGSLEQDADIVIFIYREDYYKLTKENENLTELIIAKHRNGPTKTVKIQFKKGIIKFGNLETLRKEEE